jgi:hypothetical protein
VVRCHACVDDGRDLQTPPGRDSRRRGLELTQHALPEEDRRRGEADLVQEYCSSLGIAHGLIIWLVTSASAKQVHSLQICLAMVQRYATAFAELDTPGALNVMGA